MTRRQDDGFRPIEEVLRDKRRLGRTKTEFLVSTKAGQVLVTIPVPGRGPLRLTMTADNAATMAAHLLRAAGELDAG